MNSKDKDKVIGPRKPNEVSNKAHGSAELANRPRKPKRISNGSWMPKRRKQRDIGAHE